MKKFVCTICGYVHEGDSAPEKCPQCGVPAKMFEEMNTAEMTWAAEHVVGVAKDVPLSTIFRGCFPYVPAILIAVILVTAFPALATWLPTVFYG